MLNDLKQKKIFKEPIFYILLFCFILFVIGINWGLPSTGTWQSDSFAPDVPVQGLVRGFSFGYYTKYPLVHQIVLSIFNIPVLIFAFIQSLSLNGFEKELLKELIFHDIGYLTTFTLIDRFVSLIMGLFIVYLIYLSGKELFNKRVGVFSAIIVSLNPVLNHYSHVAKVEVSYIFWAMLALYTLIRVVKYDQRKDYIFCAIFTCLSFGSKDQGYAIFILPFIFYFIIYKYVFSEKQKNFLKVIFKKNTWIFILVLIIGTLVVENVFLNFEGLTKRFNHLTGDGGQRSISYTLGFDGIFALFTDITKSIINEGIGLPLFIFCIIGFFLIIYKYRNDKRNLFIYLIFIFASLSYYLFFVQLIRQSVERFQFPISIFLTIYGGFAINFLYSKLNGYYKKGFIVVLSLIFVYSSYNTFSFNINILYDVRYKAEDWMKKNIHENSKIEHYSGNSYLPRFPENTLHYKVKENACSIEERKPDYIVLTSRYYPRFLGNFDQKIIDGRITVKDRALKYKDTDFPLFFDLLLNNKLNYRFVKRFNYDIKFFKEIGLTPNHIVIYERVN